MPKLLTTTLLTTMTVLIAVSCLFHIQAAYAKDLGRVGQVYPIKEMDIVDFIYGRLKQMQQSGELEKINRQMIETAKAHTERPAPVVGISPTKTYRKWFVDPTITFEHDIKDIEGHAIVKAGTVVNPLSRTTLKNAYIFYDGDNKAQIAWVIKKDKLLRGKDKLILVNGSIAEQSNLLKKRIYFDQHGRLVNKFKIKHTPAVITQEGLKFKVEELVP